MTEEATPAALRLSEGLGQTVEDEMNDAGRYRWLVNHASSFDGTADSDNMVRRWFYRPDGREVMVQGKDLDAAIAAADAERRAILALQRA